MSLYDSIKYRNFIYNVKNKFHFLRMFKYIFWAIKSLPYKYNYIDHYRKNEKCCGNCASTLLISEVEDWMNYNGKDYEQLMCTRFGKHFVGNFKIKDYEKNECWQFPRVKGSDVCDSWL